MFSPGIYNQQRSQYVGNTMGEMMNLLPFAQQRYDESRNLFDSMDSYIDNIPHLEGDREALEMTVAPFRQVVNEARESGDYRSLYDKANKFAKKMENDRGIQTAQLSYQNMLKQQELESKLGANALTFTDPKNHRSIVYDENGKVNYNVYVPRVEERRDYDSKMTDIYGILKADGFTIDLREHQGDIQGFLEHGKVSGISNPKVRNYLSNAYMRYIDSPEGVQDFERLVAIEGLAPEEAKFDIEKRLLSVGEGMVYSDSSKSYQQNPYAKVAKDLGEMGGYGGNYLPADESNVVNLQKALNLGDLDVKDGKLVNSNTLKNQIKMLEDQGFNENTIPAGVNLSAHLGMKIMKNFVAITKWIGDGITGKKSELEITPDKQIALDNMRNSAATVYGKDPSEVTSEELAAYYNNNKRKQVALSAPVRDLSNDERKFYNSELIGEPVKLADGSTVVPSKALSTRKMSWKGNNVNFSTVFGEKGIIGRPASVDVISEFGADNGFGFEAGLVLQVIDQEGNEHTVPVEKFAGPENPVKRIENAIHQTKYNTLTHTSNLSPVSVQGNQITVASNPITGDYKMFVNNSIDNPLIVTKNEINGERMRIAQSESPEVAMAMTDESIASKVLFRKWILESQK